jgi:hypothetical protein
MSARLSARLLSARLPWRAILVAVTAACSTAPAGPVVTCGADTVQQGTECVPKSLVKCGEGTRLEGSDCVPSSTLKCGEGTIESAGACVPASTLTCGPGTEERDGTCLTVNPMRRVTVAEGSEPNAPPGKPTRFTLPAVGAPPAVLGGTISKIDENGVDIDGFVFQAAGLTRIRLEAKAVGVPVVAFLVEPCKVAGADTCEVDDSWLYRRIGLSIESRDVTRELVLPQAGDYLILVSDEQNLTGGLPMGGRSFTYTLDVTQLPQPASPPMAVGGAATGEFDALTGHALDVPAGGGLYDVELEEQGPLEPFIGTRALWAVGADGKVALSAEDLAFAGETIPMSPVRARFPAGTARIFPDYFLGVLELPRYSLRVSSVPVTTIDPAQPTVQGSLAGDGNEVYAVDVAGGSVLEVVLTPDAASTASHRLELRDARFKSVARVTGTKLTRYVPVAEAGRYYLTVSDPSFSLARPQLPYALSVVASPTVTVGPVSVGTPEQLAAQPLPATGGTWYAVFAANDAMLTAVATPVDGADLALAVLTAGASAPRSVDAAGPGAAETTPATCLASGEFVLVRVGGTPAQGGTAATFDLAVSSVAGLCEREPNNTAATATPVAVPQGAPVVVHAAFSAGSDLDFYELDVQAQSTVAIETGADQGSPNVDTIVTLQGTGQASDPRNDDCPGRGNFSCLTVSLAPGKYALKVEVFGGSLPSAAGPYLLTVSATP